MVTHFGNTCERFYNEEMFVFISVWKLEYKNVRQCILLVFYIYVKYSLIILIIICLYVFNFNLHTVYKKFVLFEFD